MEWKKGDKYFFKLDDGSCLTGEIKGTVLFGDIKHVVINDKFNKEVGFREDRIMKYELITMVKELITSINKVNK